MILLLFYILSNITFSQSISKERKTEIGLFFGFGLLSNSANIQASNSIPPLNFCCNEITEGNSYNYEIGIKSYFALNKKFGIIVIPSFRNLNTELIESERIYPIFSNKNPLYGVFEHILNAEISSVGLSALFSYQLLYYFDISTGLRYNLLFGGQYDYQEKIVSPSNGVWENASKLRNQQSGEISSLKSGFLSYEIMISYGLPLNKTHTLMLVPSINTSFGLNSILENSNWKMNFYYFSIGISYDLFQNRSFQSSPLHPKL